MDIRLRGEQEFRQGTETGTARNEQPQAAETRERCFIIMLFRTIIHQKLCLYGVLVSLIPVYHEFAQKI